MQQSGVQPAVLTILVRRGHSQPSQPEGAPCFGEGRKDCHLLVLTDTAPLSEQLALQFSLVQFSHSIVSDSL